MKRIDLANLIPNVRNAPVKSEVRVAVFRRIRAAWRVPVATSRGVVSRSVRHVVALSARRSALSGHPQAAQPGLDDLCPCSAQSRIADRAWHPLLRHLLASRTDHENAKA